MENKTIKEQIKDAFEQKLSNNALLDEVEIEQICSNLFNATSTEKAVDLMYKIIGGDLGENTST